MELVTRFAISILSCVLITGSFFSPTSPRAAEPNDKCVDFMNQDLEQAGVGTYYAPKWY